MKGSFLSYPAGANTTSVREKGGRQNRLYGKGAHIFPKELMEQLLYQLLSLGVLAQYSNETRGSGFHNWYIKVTHF